MSGLVLATLPVWAEAEMEIETPAVVEAPTSTTPSLPIESADSNPVETSAEALLRPQVTTAPTVETDLSEPEFVDEASPLSTPRSEAQAPVEFNTNFIDPTDYSLGATPSPDSPSLVFLERSTSCQFTAEGGEVLKRSCGEALQASDGEYPAVSQPSGSHRETRVSHEPGTVGELTVISREALNDKLRPLSLLRRGAEEFIFPLSIPAPITSLFGWRNHPIFQERRFHAGVDLAAPEGTPVLAAKDGEVITADYLGGYGLTVMLRHENGTQETRYPHLSQILVRPGEQIKQGEVVGLVGSTGNSTGPHLHFELRELTAQGWVLIDPNDLMNYATANLVDVLNSPLQALGISQKPDQSSSSTLVEGELELPHRPAQPNAS
ncbi:M23 family metallopeptidase [Oscillatoria sp. CS-180]|uniref:M23 family metallopeptidase n=1 Tax=Oscillatoria sp. CS-180 TaxID=3021720 RepID=UPI0023312456|nr:M23 family metallopeptidase [Oscillatoria sp. CS-180]MDB9529768.1 M23 family metallopeptidase [Oscillatoria sp. CS-180]